MSGQNPEMAIAAGRLDASRIADLLLLRIACAGTDGATAAQIFDDMQEFVSHRLTQGEWRSQSDTIIEELITKAALKKKGGSRLIATKKDTKAALKAFDLSSEPAEDWPSFRDTILVARALGLKSKSAKSCSALKSSERLRAAVLKTRMELPISRDIPTVAEVRTALALRALQKSFDEPLPQKFTPKSKIPEKLALFLAGRLFRRPREVTTTSELFASLSAEVLGLAQRDAKSLRLELLRSLVTQVQGSPEQKGKKNGAQAPQPDDLQGFASEINHLAKDRATGWDGNKRAYISHVWMSLQSERPNWGIDENQFKRLLTEAHRAGHLTLQIADLRNKSNIGDIQASVTKYKNNEWHLIRVEE